MLKIIDVRPGRRRTMAASGVLFGALALSSCSSTETTETADTGGPGGNCTATGATPAAVTAPADAVSATQADVEASVTAAEDFLATLDDTTREATSFEFTDLDAKRCSWSNFPAAGFSDRQGAKLGDLDETQREAALALVDSLMSDAGSEMVRGIMTADDYLASEGGQGGFGSGEYCLAFYGEPSADEPWTMQLGGHHLAVHVTVGGDTISTTPYFSGVEPVSFTYEGTDYDPLASKADAFFGLFESFDEDQLAAAELSGAYDDIVMGPGTDTGYPEQEGIAYADLDAGQQEQVRAVIEAWVGDTETSISQALIDQYVAQLDETTIGWSVSTDKAAPAYLRIDGPRLWIEHLNAEGNDTTEIHYHTIYRDKQIDYGTGAE